MTETFTGPLHSQRVSPEQAAQIVRIPPGSDTLKLFATDFMGDVRDDTAPACVRLEAVLNPLRNTWQIDRLTRLPGGEGSVTNHATELNDGLCFFDALHYCARFQATAEASGQQVIAVSGERWASVPHYKIVAEDAGQIIDKDGEAHPCAHGTTLGRGFFSDREYNVAGKTRDVALLEQSAAAGNSTLEKLKRSFPSVAGTSVNNADLMNQSVDRLKLIKQMDLVIDAGNFFTSTFRRAARMNFLSPLHDPDSEIRGIMYCATVVTLGSLPFLNRKDFFPEKYTRDSLSKFVKVAATLPACREKALCMQFAEAAAYAISMEKAAQLYGRGRNGRQTKAYLEKGLAMIESAGVKALLGQPEIEQIKANYLAGEFKAKEFYNQIESAWAGEKIGLETSLESVKKKIVDDVTHMPLHFLRMGLRRHD